MVKNNKKYGKIVVCTLFFILITMSVAQALIQFDINNKEPINSNSVKFFDRSLLMHPLDDPYFVWEDDFETLEWVDPNPTMSYDFELVNGIIQIKNTYPMWTDPDWTRIKPIEITNNVGQPLADYAVHLTINYDPDMQSNYDDIRFKHDNSGSVWLNYWIENSNPTSAEVWVKIPVIPIGMSMMYLFYGNPSAVSESDFYGVFTDWDEEWPNDEQISYHSILEGAWNPDVAYGSDRFLVTWEELISPPITKVAIKGQLFDNYGVKIGNIFNIRTGNPPYRHQKSSVAYGNGKFFVAWVHWGWPTNPETQDIIGRLVTPSGVVSSDIKICQESNVQDDPNVAYDSVNNRFLVVWEDARGGTGNYNLYGKLFDTNGNQIGNEKNICVASNTQCEPWIAFDSINEQYMIVWEEGDNPANGPFEIHGGLFDENLNEIWSGLIYDDPSSPGTDFNFPCVIFCEETERYLITWNDCDISAGDLYGNVWGNIRDESGNVVVSPFMIKPGNFYRTDIVPYLTSSFLVSYDGGGKVWGKLVSSEGDVPGNEIQMSASTAADADTANIAFGDEKIFATWEDERLIGYSDPDAFGNMWNLNIPSGTDVSYVFDNEKELILAAHVTSIEIEPLNLTYWEEFTEVSSRGDIIFDILDGNTGTMILHDISSGWNLSGVTASSIRLMATFSRTNPSSSPVVDIWGVSYFTNNPPNTPSNPNPSNGAINVDINADMSWTGGDPNPGDTVTYDVYFGTISSPPKVVDNQSATSYNPGTLNFGTTYYWKIVSWDNYGASTAGSVWSFTTRFNNPPYTPNNPDPPNGAVNVNLDADLSWSGGDPDGDIVTYDMYFGTTSPPPKVITNQSNITYDPGTLNHNTIYYWKIVAWDEYGATTTGPLWLFTTRANSPPNTPSAPSPLNGAVNVDLNEDLSWIGGDPDPGDTVTYDVYFGTTNPPPIVVYGHTITTYDPGTMIYGTTYYWKIVSWDNYGASTAGSVWSFTTRFNNPPYTPNNPDPPNGAANVDLNTDLSWDGGDPDPGDTVTYDVYFGTINPPPKAVNNQSTTTYNPGTLNFGTTYYWKIVAWDNHGAISSGPIWNFTTGTNYPPNIPSNPHPDNGETSVSIEIDLSWSGGDPNPGDTVKYDVYFDTISPPTKVSANQSGTTYDPGTLSYNTTYYWQIVAWDDIGASAFGSIWEFTTGEEFNQPPNTPSIRGSDSIIPGIAFVKPNKEYKFTIVTSDSDGDDVYYWIDWGDNSNSGWLGPNPTNVEITANHTWSQPISLKFIKVKAKDIYGGESGWGHLIIIVNNKMQSYNQVMVKQGLQSYSSTTMSG